MFRKLNQFPSSGEGSETPILLSPLERAKLNPVIALSEGPNRVGISLHSPGDGNRFNFRRVVFSSYLEFRTMNKVQKPRNSVY
jgi:hypothetical protein